MQDRPTAPELLDAMAAQLFGEVREWVPRERRFQVLVLANLCAVIARELRAGEEPDDADEELFRECLTNVRHPETEHSTDPDRPDRTTREFAAELSAAIRAGAMDGQLDAVIANMREHVSRKLEIARPGYSG